MNPVRDKTKSCAGGGNKGDTCDHYFLSRRSLSVEECSCE